MVDTPNYYYVRPQLVRIVPLDLKGLK